MQAPEPNPFVSAQAAWLWTSAVLAARHNPALPRPPAAACQPEEVLRCLDDIYRARLIELLHARVLRHYGQKGRAPHPGLPRERCDRILWTEAMEALDGPLRRAGIVAGLAKWWEPA